MKSAHSFLILISLMCDRYGIIHLVRTQNFPKN